VGVNRLVEEYSPWPYPAAVVASELFKHVQIRNACHNRLSKKEWRVAIEFHLYYINENFIYRGTFEMCFWLSFPE
jgi:hypothetical protein